MNTLKCKSVAFLSTVHELKLLINMQKKGKCLWSFLSSVLWGASPLHCWAQKPLQHNEWIKNKDFVTLITGQSDILECTALHVLLLDV